MTVATQRSTLGAPHSEELPSLPTGDASLLFSRVPDLGDPQTCETATAPDTLPLSGPINLGAVSQIPFGEGRVFQIGEEPVAVFHLRSGAVYAVQAQCPHRSGPLIDGLVGGTTVVCPLHAWKFDLTTGKALFGTCDIHTYPVTLSERGEILLLP